jgi:hypothetical protein
MRSSWIVLLLCMPTLASADRHENNTEVIKISPDIQSNRLCVFEDISYSKGAIISINDVTLVCDDVNDYETNGQLGWREHGKEREKKIKINRTHKPYTSDQ